MKRQFKNVLSPSLAALAKHEAIYKAQQSEADGAGDDAPRSVDDDIVDADFEDLGENKRK